MRPKCLMDHSRDDSQHDCGLVKSFDEKMEHLEIYKAATAYEDDYRFYPPEKRVIYKWRKDKIDVKKEMISTIPYMDQESYVPMRSKLPFDIHWDPKPIVGTYPKMTCLKDKDDMQEALTRVTEKELLQAIQSRPSPIISPAIRVDEIDLKERRSIIASIYDSDWKMAARYAAETNFTNKSVGSICTDLGRAAIHYRSDIRPLIEGRFRRRSRDWDKEQTTECVNPTVMYWLNKELKEDDIFATEKLVTQEIKEEIRPLIEDDMLRIPYDLTKPKYKGFHPVVPYGITMEKKELPVTHPDISVYQTIIARYFQEDLARKRAQRKKLT